MLISDHQAKSKIEKASMLSPSQSQRGHSYCCVVNLSTVYASIPYVISSYYISHLAGTKMNLRSWAVIYPGGVFLGTISSLYYKTSAEATHGSSHSSKAYLKNKKKQGQDISTQDSLPKYSDTETLPVTINYPCID